MVDSGTPKQIFKNYEALASMGLDIPQVTHLMIKLKSRGKDVATDVVTVEEAEAEVLKAARRKGHA